MYSSAVCRTLAILRKNLLTIFDNIVSLPGGSWNPHRVELAIWTHYVAHDLKPELLADIPSASAAAAASPPKPAVPAAAAATTADDETTAETPSETPSPATQTDEDSNGAGEDATNSRPNTADPDAKAASENTTATDSESAEKGELKRLQFSYYYHLRPSKNLVSLGILYLEFFPLCSNWYKKVI